MKISLDWLNGYLDRWIDAESADQTLTAVGFPIDARTEVPAAGGHKPDLALEVEVTSNRSDCLSHVGVAREIGAATGRKLRYPEIGLPVNAGPNVQTVAKVDVQDSTACPLYTARVIRHVKVGPSPTWLVRRLEAIGLRSVNNVVDITNFVLHELGQPLHAFDLDKLQEHRIVVRSAVAGESILAIDGTKHALKPGMLVIADATRPVAIAGVMGGKETEVTASTTNILIESALFEPLSVRRTSRALKLSSDSSYRFERGLDPAGVERASCRAARLIQEIAGGTIAAGVVRVGGPDPTPRTIDLRIDRCNQILSFDLPATRMIELLAHLGLQPKHDVTNKVIHCTVPTFRLDLSREIDLIEEVGRLHGLDHIPVRSAVPIVVQPPQPVIVARQKLAEVLVAHGYHETITHSFVSVAHGKPFLRDGQAALEIQDERRRSEPMLRPSVLPSLLHVVKANHDVGNAGVKLFESASVWHRNQGANHERRSLGLVAEVHGKDEAGALRELRGAIEELVEQLAGPGALQVTPWQDAGFTVAAEVHVAGQSRGVIGILSPAVRDAFDLRTGLVVAELEIDPILALYPPQRTAGALPRFPGIERDLSIIVAEQVAWNEIERGVLSTSPALLESLSFITSYRGKPIPPGHKSVSFRMVFREPSSTLRHEQVDPQVKTIVEKLTQSVGAQVRA